MSTFAIGDIHGAHKALLQCLKLSHFDKKVDRLICLGDICDRGADVKACIDELLTIPNCVYILGNHDDWALHWMQTGEVLEEWRIQGGQDTLRSYANGVPAEHIEFLTKARLYFIDHNRLFVHGGFDPGRPIDQTSKDIFLWDRTVIRQAQQLSSSDPSYKFGPYDEIFVGHTPVQKFGSSQEPQYFCNVWDLDTGAGHGKKLSIMDVETKQFWQSDI